MAVNKNFVVKNGLEVATDLIFASSALDKVGIGSTLPTATLEVGGDLEVTGNASVVGVATVQDDLVVGTGGTVIIADVSAGRIGLNNSSPGHNIHASNVGSGLTTLYVDGGQLKVDGDIYGDDVVITNVRTGRLSVTGVSTFGDNSGADLVDINCDVDMDANLHLTGFSTFTQLIDANNGIDASTLKVEDLTDNRIVISGTGGELEDDSNLTFDGSEFNVGAAVSIYASSGIVSATEFYGDGSNLSGVTATAGGSLGFSTAGTVGYGVTFLKFVGAGVSNLTAPHSGISTLTIVGGSGGSANIGIGSTVGDAFNDTPTAGNLWYNTDEARLFIYYNDGSSSQWVDAAPFNVGILTSTLESLNQGTALVPPVAFSGDSSTGFFSPTSGQQTFVSVGSSILNINPSGVIITGLCTASNFHASSDASLKENVTTVNNALDLTSQLRGVRFDWKESGSSDYGVIAQELEEVLPELVTQGDPKSVNYNGIIGVLIEAVKELSERVKTLEDQ